MGDIFDDIDLEELANSESPIVENTGSGESSDRENEITPDNKEATQEDPEAVDLGQLAELDAIDEIQTNDEEIEEDGEPTEKETSQTPATKSEGSSPSSHDKFTSFASALTEAGVFSSLEEEELEEIKDVDSLISAVEKQIKANEHVGLSEDQREYLEALKAGIPTEAYARAKSSADQYRKVTDTQIEDNQNLQYELIRRNFLIKGHSAQDSDKFARLSVQAGTGTEDAIQAKEVLVAHEESKIQDRIKEEQIVEAQRLEDEKKEILNLRSKVNEMSEILPGVRVTSPTKDRIFDSMTTPIKMEDGEPRNEVMDSYKNDQDYKIKLHALHVITKGFTDFSKFTRIKDSKAAERFSEILKSSDSTTGRSGSIGGISQGGQTLQDIADALDKIDFK
jgi:hypothetical protein